MGRLFQAARRADGHVADLDASFLALLKTATDIMLQFAAAFRPNVRTLNLFGKAVLRRFLDVIWTVRRRRDIWP